MRRCRRQPRMREAVSGRFPDPGTELAVNMGTVKTTVPRTTCSRAAQRSNTRRISGSVTSQAHPQEHTAAPPQGNKPLRSLVQHVLDRYVLKKDHPPAGIGRSFPQCENTHQRTAKVFLQSLVFRMEPRGLG